MQYQGEMESKPVCVPDTALALDAFQSHAKALFKDKVRVTLASEPFIHWLDEQSAPIIKWRGKPARQVAAVFADLSLSPNANLLELIHTASYSLHQIFYRSEFFDKSKMENTYLKALAEKITIQLFNGCDTSKEARIKQRAVVKVFIWEGQYKIWLFDSLQDLTDQLWSIKNAG